MDVIIKSQIDFEFYINVVLDPLKTVAVFSRQNTEFFFGENIFRSSRSDLSYEKGV